MSAPLKERKADRLGCVQLSRSRRTGTLIGIYDAREAGLDEDGGVWVTMCEDHGFLCNHETQTLARRFASYPDEWCEGCQRVIARTLPPMEVRRTAPAGVLAETAQVKVRLPSGKEETLLASGPDHVPGDPVKVYWVGAAGVSPDDADAFAVALHQAADEARTLRGPERG